MDNRKRKIIAIILVVISAFSILFYFLYGWPLLFLLFIPGLFFTNKPQTRESTNNICQSCNSVIDPSWKYCPFCSSKVF